jgi:hypothetical protein
MLQSPAVHGISAADRRGLIIAPLIRIERPSTKNHYRFPKLLGAWQSTAAGQRCRVWNSPPWDGRLVHRLADGGFSVANRRPAMMGSARGIVDHEAGSG